MNGVTSNESRNQPANSDARLDTAELYRLAKCRFWALLIPLTLINIAALMYAMGLLQRTQITEVSSKTAAAIELAKGYVRHDFETVISDLQFLAESDALTGYLFEAPDSAQQTHVEHAFFHLSKTHGLYDQIRLLSAEGRELVRVNYRNGNPEVVARAALQDKANRYYFSEASRLADDSIYISQLDLNIENREIERPYKPMIRFARALHDQQGTLKGVIVLNYLAEKMLQRFRQNMALIPGESMLLNAQGYWLSCQRPEDEWGFMFDRGTTFAKRFPAAWEQITARSAGELDTQHGHFSFATVYPLSGIVANGMAASHFLQNWKIVVVNHYQGAGLKVLTEQLQFVYPLLLVYPIGLLLIWYWARASAGRKLAQRALRRVNQSLESTVELRTAELQATKDVTILCMATLAETRDNETGQHIRRTQNYVKALASHLQSHPDFAEQLSDEAIGLICKSAPLHDIGKVGIPDSILLKPGKLTADEFAIMKKHTSYGSDALESAINTLATTLAIDGSGTFLHYARDIAHYHHERWDGRGYPKGLAGDAIPLAARLMALADVYDALVSPRVYKKPFAREVAEDIILNQSPGQFDPRVLDAFRQLRDQFWAIRQRYREG